MAGAGWLGRHRIDLIECNSTNDEAARLARAGAEHGTVVTAEAQRAGRGREGRAWASPPGLGLYLSAVVRPPLPLALVPPMTLAIGIGVCEAAREAGADARLKWPNDVLAAGRKLAGILVEAQSQGSRLEAAVVGIGVNLGGALPPELAARAITLAEAAELAAASGATAAGAADRPAGSSGSSGSIGSSGSSGSIGSIGSSGSSGSLGSSGSPGSIDRAAFIASLLGHVEVWIDRYVAAGLGPVIEAWHARMAHGLAVRAVIGGAVVDGEAAGLDEGGALLIREPGGRIHKVRSGDVEVIRVIQSGTAAEPGAAAS